MMKENTIDVLGITETWIRSKEDDDDIREEAREHDMKWIGIERSELSNKAKRGSGGIGLLYNVRVRVEVESVRVEGIMVSSVLVEDMECLLLVLCYVTSRSSHSEYFDDQIKYIEEVITVNENNKIIVCGDFNSRIGELPSIIYEQDMNIRKEYKRISDDKYVNTEGRDLVLLMNSMNMVILNGTHDKVARPTYIGRSNVQHENTIRSQTVIDLMIVPYQYLEDVQTVDVLRDSDERIGTDHACVILDMMLKPSTERKVNLDQNCTTQSNNHINNNVRNRWKTRMITRETIYKWKEFSEILNEKVSNIIEITDNSEEIWKVFKEMIIQGANEIIGKRKITQYNCRKRIFDPMIKELIEEKKQIWKQIQKNDINVVDIKKQYRQIQKKISRRACTLRQDSRNRIIHEIEEMRIIEPHKYWNRLKMMSGLQVTKQQIPNSVIIDNMESTDNNIILQKWYECWKTIGEHDTNNPKFNKQFMTDMQNEIVNILNMSYHEYNYDLDREIEFEEVEMTCRRIPNNKASGEDEIVNEFVKYGDRHMWFAVYQMLNKLYENELIPHEWMRGMIFPIFKDGDKRNPLNYRPISLLSIMYKIYATVLNNRLVKWIERTKKFEDEQAGFRPERGTSEQVFILYEVLSMRYRCKKDTYCCFIDVKKAYDSVWREGLWMRLWEEGVRGKLWRVIRNMYRSIQSVVLINDDRTEWFNVDVGVRQGCVLSPTLFNIFINRVIKEVKAMRKGVMINQIMVSILLFADDIVLITDNTEKLQDMINQIQSYSKKWRFELNKKKCECMIFKYGKKTHKAVKWYIDDEELKIVDGYKYLGVEMMSNMKWDGMKERVLTKTKKRMNIMFAMTSKISELSVQAQINIYNTLIRPYLEYACEIWGGGEWEAAERIQKQMARRILHCSHHTADEVVLGELGWYKLKVRRDIRRLKFMHHMTIINDERLVKKIFKASMEIYTENKRKNRICRKSWWYHTDKIIETVLGNNIETVINDIKTNRSWVSEVQKMIYVNEMNNWRRRMMMKPKLRTYITLKKDLILENYLLNETNIIGRYEITKLRGGTNRLRIETGRYEMINTENGKRNLMAEERLCTLCKNNEIEDERHFIEKCDYYYDERKFTLELIQNVNPYIHEIKMENVLGDNINEIDGIIKMFLIKCVKKRRKKMMKS